MKIKNKMIQNRYRTHPTLGYRPLKNLIIKKKMKAMSKQQLADAAGVSVKVLMSWCKQYQAELEAMGVKTKTKVLPPNAVRFIAEKYCIDINE